jgi:phage gp29-like protein
MTAKSFEEIREGLIELGQGMDVSKIGNLMQKAYMAAELAGRYEVDNGG